ncbi:MAG: hypothetical protein KBT68_05120 [bacterium]|nr:hypothetical protein [Candidatus Colisoma equi]
MKKLAFVSLVATLFAGCCSYTDIGHLKPGATADDGEKAIATVTVFNISYSIFGILPFESGTTWKEGPYKDRSDWNWTFFEDRCTLDENLASIRAACKEVGSSRIENLVTDSDSWRFWSLFIIKRKVMKSSCTILK